MNFKLKSLVLSMFLMFLPAIGVSEVYAVKNPKAIAWTAKYPMTFVYSMYNGVYGRVPTSKDEPHLSNHIATITDSASRLRLLWHFVNTPEYRERNLHRAPKVWSVYYRFSGNYIRYTVSRSHPAGARYWKGPHNWGMSMALAGYYRAFYSRRR